MINDRYVSPYSADDSDDINERTNYWRNWEYAERLASATTCDFMYHCFECPLLCGDDEWEEIVPCGDSTPLPINEFFNTEMYHHTCEHCGRKYWSATKEYRRDDYFPSCSKRCYMALVERWINERVKRQDEKKRV